MNNRMVILGAGESGAGSAVLAKKQGFEVFVSDQGAVKPTYRDLLQKHDITWEEGTHSENEILKAGEVIKSPGIPEDANVVVKVREQGIPVISEIEFASRYTSAYTICITGSNGKTTTAKLTHFMLDNSGLNAGLAGNVGNSFAYHVATAAYDYYVIELSSFQLDGIYEFKPDIAILLNITPDHLDRYGHQLQRYVDSKFRITMNLDAGNLFVYNADDEIIQAELSKRKLAAEQVPFSHQAGTAPGAFIENETMHVIYKNSELTMSIHDLALKGKHNAYNSMAASIAAQALNIRKESIRKSLANFQGVEHRLEHVLKIHGIEFVNDSKATNVNSTWYALESMPGNLIWIAGGQDKGNDYSFLRDLVSSKVKAIICLGVDNTKIHQAFQDIVDTIVDTKSAEEAVRTAYYLGKKGDTVLLSPACASFDLFENYEERGDRFKQAVRRL
ncbi:MAG: UDP-N-acetylmuramoyl-L-alanine--D-glutamate ligase [Bacteroidales bacterium]|nr:UDP-N-acetylmuramoyl-L-alanine--D-glutamate ligase [Bacteroidales bacterium]